MTAAKAEVLDPVAESEMALAVRTPEVTSVANWTPRMVITVDDAVEMVNQRVQFMEQVISRVTDGVYTIPGSEKRALGKPGAERLLSAYGLFPETEDEAPPVLDLSGEGDGEPLILFRRRCTIWRQTGPGPHDRFSVARMSGTCHSREVKYRYRNADRVCPDCGSAAILKSKNAGEGWFCWRKKDGCGATFPTDDARLTEQVVGRIPNPDVADLMNTIEKMADKRALVAATIAATGWSDLVTQDLDEMDGAASGVVSLDVAAPAKNGSSPGRATAGTEDPRRAVTPSEASRSSAASEPDVPCPADGCEGHLKDRGPTKNGDPYISCDSWRNSRNPGCGTTIWKTNLADYVKREEELADAKDAEPALDDITYIRSVWQKVNSDKRLEAFGAGQLVACLGMNSKNVWVLRADGIEKLKVAPQDRVHAVAQCFRLQMQDGNG